MSRKLTYDVAFYLPRIGPALLPSRAEYPGGAETQVAAISRGLAARGWKVALVTFDTPEGLPPSLDGVDIITRPPYRRGARKLREPLDALRSLGRVRARCFVQRCATFETGIAAGIAFLHRAPFIYSAANDSDFDFARIPWKRWELPLYLMGVKSSAEIVVQTDRQAELCRTVLGRDPLVIRSLVGHATPSNASAGDVIWAARLSTYKNPQAFVEVARHLPCVSFTMVGIVDPLWPDGARVLEDARTLPNVTVLQGLPRAALLDRIGLAAAVVSTSRAEGMPNIFLEAWARGVPVASLDAEPVRDMEARGLGFSCGGSLDRLGEVVATLWNERQDRPRRTACVTYARTEHSSEVVVGQWETLLHSVITLGGPRAREIVWPATATKLMPRDRGRQITRMIR